MTSADGGLETAQSYAALIDNFPNMVFVHQRGRTALVNQRCVEVLGYSREELTAVDFDFRTLVAPECSAVIEAAYRAHAEGRDVPPYEYVTLTKDGRRIDVIQSTRLVRFMGQPAILGVTTDITDRREVERALQQSEARYRTLVEICPDAITLVDREMKVQMCNRQAARLVGHDAPEELVGMSAAELIAPEYRDRAAKNARQTFETGEDIRQIGYHVLRKDGAAVPVELSASVLRDGTGVPSGFLAVVRDATEHQRLLEEKRALTSKVLDAHEEERIRLARELHDGVGQMLTVIKMEAEWLATRSEPGVFAERSAELLQRAQDTLSMVRQLSQGLRPSVLDDLGIGCALESLAQEMTRHSGIRCEPAVAELAELPIEIATMLYRVAQEALANVVHHSGAQRADLSLVETGEHLILTIEDDGRGIDVEAHDRTSLGIAHMRERAEMLRGELTISSCEPTGTCVTVKIPSRVESPR